MPDPQQALLFPYWAIRKARCETWHHDAFQATTDSDLSVEQVSEDAYAATLDLLVAAVVEHRLIG